MEPGELTRPDVDAPSGPAAPAGSETDTLRRLELANATLLETNAALARAAFAKRSSAAAMSLAKRDAHLAEVEAELTGLRDEGAAFEAELARLQTHVTQLESEKARLEGQLRQLGASHESLERRLQAPRHRAADRFQRGLARNPILRSILTRAGEALRRRR